MEIVSIQLTEIDPQQNETLHPDHVWATIPELTLTLGITGGSHGYFSYADSLTIRPPSR